MARPAQALCVCRSTPAVGINQQEVRKDVGAGCLNVKDFVEVRCDQQARSAGSWDKGLDPA